MYGLLSNILKDHKGEIIFNCFGIWHILYMLIIFGFIMTMVLLLKNKTENTKKKAINLTIDVVFGLYILDFFLMPLAYGSIDIEKLPFHICTISCVLCFLSRHNKFMSKYKLQFALLGLIGNIIYVIYPAGVGWYQIAPYSYRVIQTLLYHGLMTLYGILTICYDEEKLSWKACYKELTMIVLLTLWALLGNTIYNNELRIYNWFFVVQDPFYLLPKDLAAFMMPFIMIIVIFLADILVYFSYFGIKKLFKIFNK
jgi:hypothetical protein